MQVGQVEVGEFRQITPRISKTVQDRCIVSIKDVPDMTYNVFGGTLNLAQLNSIKDEQEIVCALNRMMTLLMNLGDP